MPATKVLFYSENGESPVFEWLCELQLQNPQAFSLGIDRIQELKYRGFELRRPTADFVRDGLYELRWKQGRVQYRILYFFHGKNVAILSHGLTKEQKLDERDIKRALKRKALFEQNAKLHSLDRELPHA